LKRSLKNISIKDLALIIGAQLSKYGIDAVLTGGAVVSIYSKNKYVSYDLDFVTYDPHGSAKAIKEAMKEIGFAITPNTFFSNPDCKYVIEFIPAPLSVGSEPAKEIKNIKSGLGQLRLLSPTDCVKDRLAAFYHWNDKQALEQALMVAKNNKVDMKEVQRWSKVEGKSDQYDIFLSHYNNEARTDRS
jgi:hypothetical protein